MQVVIPINCEVYLRCGFCNLAGCRCTVERVTWPFLASCSQTPHWQSVAGKYCQSSSSYDKGVNSVIEQYRTAVCPNSVVFHSGFVYFMPDAGTVWGVTVSASTHASTCPSETIVLFAFLILTWAQIHRHCLKIYPKICHKIILRQKLWCCKMILRHILG